MTGYIGRWRNGKVVHEHVLIARRVLGKVLPARAEVHHVDGRRWNNRRSNLVICQDHAYHMLIHARERALDACGHADWRKCRFCKRYDDPGALLFIRRHSGKVGQVLTYHARCSALATAEARAYAFEAERAPQMEAIAK